MPRSGQDSRRPPQAITAAGNGRSAAQPGKSDLEGRAALGLVALGLAGRVLRSPGLYQWLAVAAIVLGAVKRIGQDSGVSAMAQLKAMNKREIQRLERKAQRQHRAIKGSARMARSGRPRGLAGTGRQS
jgi:hypothetical protein